MIQTQTILQVADNTGAKEIMCIRVLRGSSKKGARVGDIIVAVVKKTKAQTSVKKSEIVRAVIVRTRTTIYRANGVQLKFNENAAIIVTKELHPKGTRLFGPIPYECREAGLNSIISLAPYII